MKSDEMEGRELDAEIEEQFFGRTPYWMRNQYGCDGDWARCDKSADGARPFVLDDIIVPHYSKDIAAAWEVVKKLRVEHQIIITVTNELFIVEIGSYDHVASDTLPLAICRAALKALGEQKDQ